MGCGRILDEIFPSCKLMAHNTGKAVVTAGTVIAFFDTDESALLSGLFRRTHISMGTAYINRADIFTVILPAIAYSHSIPCVTLNVGSLASYPTITRHKGTNWFPCLADRKTRLWHFTKRAPAGPTTL